MSILSHFVSSCAAVTRRNFLPHAKGHECKVWVPSHTARLVAAWQRKVAEMSVVAPPLLPPVSNFHPAASVAVLSYIANGPRISTRSLADTKCKRWRRRRRIMSGKGSFCTVFSKVPPAAAAAAALQKRLSNVTFYGREEAQRWSKVSPLARNNFCSGPIHGVPVSLRIYHMYMCMRRWERESQFGCSCLLSQKGAVAIPNSV